MKKYSKKIFIGSDYKGKARFFLFSVSIIIALFLIFLASSVLISTFSNSLTAENITFSGNENYTRNITFYKNANVTSATINLSGISQPLQIITSNEYSCDFDYSCGHGNDSLWDTYTTANWVTDGNKSILMNYTYSGSPLNPIFNFKSTYYRNIGISSWGYIKYYYWNYTLNNWQFFTYSNCLNSFDDRAYAQVFCNVSLPLDSLNSSTKKIRINGTAYATYIGAINTVFYESNISYENYPYNIYVLINNTNIFSYSGNFNQMNNKTNNFASTLNTALNNGACDCAGCELNGNNCTINFTFHSDTAGILDYSDINITWLEYTIPNLTIYSPNGTYTGITYIPINFTAVDDWQTDVCSYNVTRGASLEVANTYISCSANTIFTVSGDANYVFHMCVNDTSGNMNCSNSSFTTVAYVPPPIIISPGGGGGAPNIIQQLTQKITSNICDPLYPNFKIVWNNFLKEKSWENFKVMWYSFWNYALCSNAASIIPLTITTDGNVTVS